MTKCFNHYSKQAVAFLCLQKSEQTNITKKQLEIVFLILNFGVCQTCTIFNQLYVALLFSLQHDGFYSERFLFQSQSFAMKCSKLRIKNIFKHPDVSLSVSVSLLSFPTIYRIFQCTAQIAYNKPELHNFGNMEPIQIFACKFSWSFLCGQKRKQTNFFLKQQLEVVFLITKMLSMLYYLQATVRCFIKLPSA